MNDVNKATLRGRMSRGRLATILIAISSLGLLATAQPVQAATSQTVFSYYGNNCGGTTIYKANGIPWTCSFDDEFSGYRLDTSKWYVYTTASTGFSAGDTCMMANNVSVSKGELRLTSRDTGTPFTCKTPTGSFTTRNTGATIGTPGRFAQTYGRYEIRARMPQTGAGANNFWLYPVAPTYGLWPFSGEIDIAEWWSNMPNVVLPSLHYSGSTTDDSGWSCQIADPTAWHTYSLVWLPTQMTFAIDGQTCFTRTWTPNAPLVAPQPFDQPFNVILSSVVNSTSASPATATTMTTSTYEVDYMRAWK